MINTLIKLGEQLSQNRSKWDDIIDNPKTNDKKTSYVANIVFNVDNGSIDIDPSDLEEYSSRSPYEHKLIETLKGNAKKIYVSVLLDKINHLRDSFFGVEKSNKGQLTEDIENIISNLRDSDFYYALTLIYSLKEEAKKLDKKTIKNQLNLGNKSELIFCYSSIKSNQINEGETTELSKLDGFEDYIDTKFFKSQTKKENEVEKLDYSLGTKSTNVITAKFQRGYNPNAMFVTTTKNFANNFNNKNFNKNYQLTERSIKYLDRASKHLLNKLNFRIAGLPHMIIPEFLSFSDIDIDLAIDDMALKNDILFNLKQFDALNTSLKDEALDQPYWLNYIAIDSDGNFFKASNLIKDISKPFLLKILEKLYVLNDNFKEQLGKHIFNFYTLYKFIPVREGTNNNIALEFFSNLFQQRPIEKSQLFQSFNQYIRCQRSGQFDNKGFHNSYSNIYQNNSFDFAIKNAVTMYSAFFMLLDELNLLKSANTMENNTTTMTNQERSQKINEQIEEFFDKMKYNESQKALFYLGRVLNTIAYAQYQKGHTSKPIMNKINYNGMDRDDIRRLRIDLEEKANQYDILEKTQFNFSKFTDYFDYNQWNIDPEEAVFFILAGYSFFISND
jgi:CRISPR-associated protein Csh1